uniref:Uncharacterized protein n=1 Tax=Molossus molossus TaxID=27622 RepID=A0A7J8IZG3_MOLMO|nr:hypothetical protein HJG59_010387 [Molossus molossus]
MRVKRGRRPACVCVHVCTHEHTSGWEGRQDREPSGRGSWLEHGRELCIRQPSAHRPHRRENKDPSGQSPQLCGSLWTAAGCPRTILLPRAAPQKVSSSAPPNLRPKSVGPMGAAERPTHPPGQGPCCTRTGYPISLSVAQVVYLKKKTRPPQMGPSCPRQVPPQEPQREQIKEKRKVTFKWHREQKLLRSLLGQVG